MKLKNLQKLLNKAVHAHQNGDYLKAKDGYLYVCKLCQAFSGRFKGTLY